MSIVDPVRDISLHLGVAILLAVACAIAVGARSPAQAAESRFDVLEYQVEGNSVLAAIVIERAVYPHLGESRTIGDVEAARAGLERAYREAGYATVVVDIPEQEVGNGVVRLVVTEGAVERLRVTGSRYYSLGAIRAAVPALAPGTVPYFPEVQAQLGALATADRTVTPVLRPGREPGGVEVELKVDDRLPLHGSLELSNQYSPNTARLRAAASLRYDNLWQRSHSLSLFALTAPEEPSNTTVLSANYLAPVGGSYLAAYAVYSDSSVAAIGNVDQIGRGTVAGLRYIKPLPPRERWLHRLTVGVDYKDFREETVLQGADSVKTPISYLPFVVQYGFSAQDASGVTEGNAAIHFGVNGITGREQAFADKRFKARPNFIYLRGDLQRTQRLPADWLLVGRADFQASSQPLISNEQFTAGGAYSVRGYLEAEVLGDQGVRGRIEGRTPSLHERLGARVDEARALAFVDAAHLRIQDPLPEQRQTFDIWSAGLGLRLRAARALLAWLDVAWPFKATAYTPADRARLLFRVAYEF